MTAKIGKFTFMLTKISIHQFQSTQNKFRSIFEDSISGGLYHGGNTSSGKDAHKFSSMGFFACSSRAAYRLESWRRESLSLRAFDNDFILSAIA